MVFLVFCLVWRVISCFPIGVMLPGEVWGGGECLLEESWGKRMCTGGYCVSDSAFLWCFCQKDQSH